MTLSCSLIIIINSSSNRMSCKAMQLFRLAPRSISGRRRKERGCDKFGSNLATLTTTPSKRQCHSALLTHPLTCVSTVAGVILRPRPRPFVGVVGGGVYDDDEAREEEEEVEVVCCQYENHPHSE